MDLNQLRSFIAVSKHGHLTRASESLHLSQPALSAQIKALEEQLGVTLFRRTSSGMSLTPSGRVLLEEAERAMAAVQQLKKTADGLRGALTGKLTLGTVLDPATVRVGELLARATQRYPQIELELHHVVSHEALAGIRSGSLDASFYFGAEPTGELHCIPLREITYRVAYPAAWRDEVGKSWEALTERPWVAAPATSSQRQMVLEAVRGHVLPERMIEADNERLILNLVESGVGASAVREELARASEAAGRIVLWPGAKIVTHLWFVCAAERAGEPLMEAMFELLREVWGVSLEQAAVR